MVMSSRCNQGLCVHDGTFPGGREVTDKNYKIFIVAVNFKDVFKETW